jgi:GNAT superfamily N-acetyltransferase
MPRKLRSHFEVKMLEIVLAQTEAQYRQVRELLEEYIAWDATQLAPLGLDAQEALDFYFASGKEDLPGVYAPPDGRMFLASYSAQTAGCGAFHRMTADTCEMRRMYVRPEFRGKQIGRQLANALILAARETGYSIMRLETTTYLDRAIALYSALGFRTCQPYCTIPEGFRKVIVCMELDLRSAI